MSERRITATQALAMLQSLMEEQVPILMSPGLLKDDLTLAQR